MNDQAKPTAPAPVSWDKFRAWLESPRVAEILTRTLPRGVQVDAWVQAAQVAIRADAELLRCSPESLAGAVLTVASLGLRLEGPLGQAYLSAREIRRKDPQSGDWYTAGYEAEMGVGYRGLIDLCYRDPEVRDVEAVIVYEGDDLDHASGSEPFLRHSWKPGAVRTVPVAVFSGVRYRDNYYSFRLYPIGDVLEVRRLALANQRVRIEVADGAERFFKTRGYGKKAQEEPLEGADLDRIPWVAHLPAMIQKTAIRWSAKYWRANPALLQAAALAGLADSGTPQDLGAAARAMPAAVLAELVGPQAALPAVQPGGRATAAGALATAGRVAALRPAAPAEPEPQPEPVEQPPEPEPQEAPQAVQEAPQAAPVPEPVPRPPWPPTTADEALAALRGSGMLDKEIRDAIGGPIDGAPVEFLIELAIARFPATGGPLPQPTPRKGGRRGQG